MFTEGREYYDDERVRSGVAGEPVLLRSIILTVIDLQAGSKEREVYGDVQE